MTTATHSETVQHFLNAHNAPAEVRAAFMALSMDAAAHSESIASDLPDAPSDSEKSQPSTPASGESVTRALASSRKALRQSLDLYSCGYNSRNAEELGEPDENDKTEKDYERDADRIRDTIIGALGDLREALTSNSATRL